MTTKCRARKLVHDETLFCEGQEGHNSAHYAEDSRGDVHWWPNERGLPASLMPKSSSFLALMIVGAMGVLASLAMLFLVYCHHQ